jgi:hypothetical protein
MIDLDFAITGVEIARRSAVPLLLFKLRVVNRMPNVPIEHANVQAQLRIEAAHRDYTASERERLSELFGEGEDWSRGLRGLLWANASVAVPAFGAECTVDLPVPCTQDFEIAATRFLDEIERGDAPLLFLFGGPVFWRNDDGDLQIAQIAHHKEAGFRLPVAVWRELMAQHYPDTVWLRIDRALFDDLSRYKRQGHFPEIGEALRALLARGATGAAR